MQAQGKRRGGYHQEDANYAGAGKEKKEDTEEKNG